MKALVRLFVTQVSAWFVLAFVMLTLLDWCRPLVVG